MKELTPGHDASSSRERIVGNPEVPIRSDVNGRTRLESWKSIADYLNRNVRTVQRWERVEGMPIHRQQHKSGGSVYAYSLELDVWREGRSDLNGGKQPSPQIALARLVLDAAELRLLHMVLLAALDEVTAQIQKSTVSDNHLRS
jgi:hypothetical protein